MLLEQYGRFKKAELEESPFRCLLNANIEINPHQINAFCAAIQALKTGGIVLADEVGLGKTIEAGLTLKYVLDSGAKHVLIALPATLRKQWEVELEENANKGLIVLVIRKLLASSSYALIETFEVLKNRLQKLYEGTKSANAQDGFDLFWNFVEDEIDESGFEEIDDEDTLFQKQQIQAEIDEVDAIIETASRIQSNAKVKALKTAIHTAFEYQEKQNIPQKVVVFTESKRTQKYIASELRKDGFEEDDILLFNGDFNDAMTKEIYRAWQVKNFGKTNYGRSVEYKHAIVDYFKEHSKILIVTDAGSEGLNLQFCNTVINYDLPWNPQKIEQRIGRCHRYGQKYDVVAINLLNTGNEADRRVYEILSKKFELFDGVFGASDIALGALESGTSFEKTILEIYQNCGTRAEFKKAFDRLDRQLDAKRNKKAVQLRSILMTESDAAKGAALEKTKNDIDQYLQQVDFWTQVAEPDVEGKESNPNHPKYIFKGLEAEMGRPKVYDGENYDSYPVRYEQMSLQFEKSSEIELFIFNIGKIFNSKTDSQFNFHKFKETLGMSFAEVLSSFDDLVICMDEAHRYYAPASMKAINFLKPVLGLEFTATPKSANNVIYAYDLARGAVEGYLKTPVVMGRSNMAGYSSEDIEEMKIRDGLTLHEHRKGVIRQFCGDNALPYVKPIVLIACRDTNHAKEVRALIDSDSFLGGKYKGKVIEIHSNMKGDESEENIRLLLSIENAQNPVEIVLHVYKLKEGWDVNNLFTIIPLNAAKSDILAMQTIGRGLRLPFGRATGNEDIDTLDIVAHDHYRELVDEIKNSDIFKYRDLDKTVVEPSDTVDINSPVDDGQLSIFDFAVTDAGVKSFAEINTNTQTQKELYAAYLKAFGATKKKESDSYGNEQMTLDQLFDVETGEPDKKNDETSETLETTSTISKGKKPLSKDEFVQKIKEYSGKAISVPKILVQTTSEVKFKRFVVKRTIPDFEVAMAKIERFDAINQQLLTAVDAQILEVDDALNTLACMLLDSISELSYEDADFIIDVVEQYLAQIEGDEEDKRKIVRRYASCLIVAW